MSMASFGAIRAGGMRPAIFSLRSTARSPKASTGEPRPCSTSCASENQFRNGLLSLGPGAQAQTWAQAGMLRCRLNPSIGFVIFGHQSMECSFQPVSGPVQAYEGAINTVGLDLGVSEGGGLAWAVFGPANGMPYGALAGEYVGPQATLGLGSVQARTCSSVAQIAASRYSRFRLKALSRLTSLPACHN